jgi:hypothetical protein
MSQISRTRVKIQPHYRQLIRTYNHHNLLLRKKKLKIELNLMIYVIIKKNKYMNIIKEIISKNLKKKMNLMNY